MKLLLLLLVPVLSYGSQMPKKYTAEELKALKPPLMAQQYTLMPKRIASPRLRMNRPEVPKGMPFSPKHKVRKRYTAPRNSVDMRCKVPFPEIVIKFEALEAMK